MHFPQAHPWLMFLFGCWAGAFVGCAITLLLAGSRIQQLESSRERLQRMMMAKSYAKLRLRTVIRERHSA